MNTIVILLSISGLLVLGASINQYIQSRKHDKSISHVPTIPDKVPALSAKERVVLDIYLKEWQVIIETQMHFNDLILRFRSFTLTTFVTLVGAIVAISKLGVIPTPSIHLLFVLMFFLWLTSFIIDFRYYHRLLLGSVKQALKYDNSKYFKTLGLFGMTSCISDQVRPLTSHWLIIIYYTIPTIGLLVIYVLML
jgi:hypothetical protein